MNSALKNRQNFIECIPGKDLNVGKGTSQGNPNKPMGLCKGHSLSENTEFKLFHKKRREGFPGGLVVKNPPGNAGDTGSIPGPGRSYMP